MKRRWPVLLGLAIVAIVVLVDVFGFERETAIRWHYNYVYSDVDGQGLSEEVQETWDAALLAALEDYRPRGMYRGRGYRIRQLREAGEVCLPVVRLHEYRVTYEGEDFIVVSAFGGDGRRWNVLIVHEHRRLRWFGRRPAPAIVDKHMALGNRLEPALRRIIAADGGP